jgi:hypothetical protein
MKWHKVSAAIVVTVLLLAGYLPAAAQGGFQDTHEPNDRVDQATLLWGNTIQGTIAPAGDKDVYQVNVSKGDTLYITLTDLPADYDIALDGSENSELAASANGGTDDERIEWTSQRDGAVYLVVYGYRNNNSASPYTLRVLRFTPDVSQQLAELRAVMAEDDYNRLVELLQYSMNLSQCVAAIGAARSGGAQLVTAGGAKACGSVLTEIAKVTDKYIHPDALAEGDGRIVVEHSSKCLDVSGGSTDNGTPIIQWDCSGADNQAWNLRPYGGYVEIVARNGKCLDVSGESTDNGAAVIQWDCHQGNNQLWDTRRIGNGYMQIINVNSGKCLDVSGASPDNGAYVIQWECYDAANQYWSPR